MAYSALVALVMPPVYTKPDVTSVNPEGRNSQPQERKKRERKAEPENAHPVPNAQGQITGKVIDTTA